MTKEAYIHMTSAVRRIVSHLPGGVSCLRLPTYICAGTYAATLIHLMLLRDARLIRVLLVPAACFLLVTALRPIIGKQRPYDRYCVPPVGGYIPGKGKSMPSRHTASAAAIAFAVVYAFPSASVSAAMLLLCLIIAALRICTGQHDVSDVLAALLLSAVISLIGYIL